MTAITQGMLGHWLTRNGFLLIVIALFLFFSIVTQHFASVANVLAMAHTMAPLVIIASGLALVVSLASSTFQSAPSPSCPQPARCF